MQNTPILNENEFITDKLHNKFHLYRYGELLHVLAISFSHLQGGMMYRGDTYVELKFNFVSNKW